MLKVKYFSSVDVAKGKANELLQESAAIPGKGLFMNQNGLFITYDDGSGFSKQEAIAVIIDSIKDEKLTLITNESQLRLYTKKKTELTQENKSRELKPMEQDQLDSASNLVLSTQAEKDRIYALIEAHESFLKDIQEDNFNI